MPNNRKISIADAKILHSVTGCVYNNKKTKNKISAILSNRDRFIRHKVIYNNIQRRKTKVIPPNKRNVPKSLTPKWL